MRKRERDKIINSIRIVSNDKQGEPISVRPFEEDHRKLEEISNQTGEKKGAIVRRMINFALSDRMQPFGSGRCQEKLDWLVRSGRHSEANVFSANSNVIELSEKYEQLEKEVVSQAEAIQIVRCLVSEIYSMSSVSVSSLNLLLTKLIEFTATDADDRKESVIIASTAMADLIEHATADLKKCLLFYGHSLNGEIDEKSHIKTKIDILKERITSGTKLPREESIEHESHR